MERTDEQKINKNILIATTTSSFLVPFMSSAINIAAPDIAKKFNLVAENLNLVITIFLLFSAAFILPMGKLSDTFDRTKIFITGLISFTISTLMCAIAPNITVLFIFRALQGFFSAFVFVTSIAILIENHSPKIRGRLLGINTATVYLGTSIGPFLGGILVRLFGFRSIFLFAFLVGFVASFISLFLLKKEIKVQQHTSLAESLKNLDKIGTIFSIVGLFLLIYGASTFELGKTPKMLFFLGGVLLILFVGFELATQNPLLDVKLFVKIPQFGFSNLAALINYSCTFSASYLLSLYLQIVKALPAQVVGSILILQPISQVITSLISGRASEKIEPRKLATAGMVLTTAGLFIFSLFSSKTNIVLVIVNLIIMGIGFGLFSSPNTNVVMSSVPQSLYGAASSTISVMRVMGQAFSMAIVSFIFSLYLKGAKLSHENYLMILKSMKISFFVFSVLSIVGIVASIKRGNIYNQENSN
ncbi:major facilitator superfamily MFS_1 [Caldicellulosiruptor saccharolyticus DSM 8903]|uniref:Major facilitator superfamily MFS_1 n=1 Tax=Caldicellulosiruptor saccharolyticus (strain ATCC 43494 / DSM 8903 / Tp8T 6331) TaxID=351627 RepID=A4XGU5_CALS8|nr:MFS transporter [Caldicellulosiruptor saccharolyticus]ABP66130.1 major facilitator superfamily MFS_1 [Caldicellulosiruptor saccharolyticus DSM 8903]